jgi:hypothetical protein
MYYTFFCIYIRLCTFFLLLTTSQTAALTAEDLVMILDKKLERNQRPFHQAMDDLKKSTSVIL